MQAVRLTSIHVKRNINLLNLKLWKESERQKIFRGVCNWPEKKEWSFAPGVMKTSESGWGEPGKAVGMESCKSVQGWGCSHRKIRVTETPCYCELESEIGIQLLKTVTWNKCCAKMTTDVGYFNKDTEKPKKLRGFQPWSNNGKGKSCSQAPQDKLEGYANHTMKWNLELDIIHANLIKKTHLVR